LGNDSAKQLIAATIDRYLVSIGKKQLFGTQAFSSEAENHCFCLEPVEQTFSDSSRKAYTNLTLQDRYDWLASINQGINCPTFDCKHELTDTKKGTIPGFW
jgi:hypothetical protein